jgi:hypothetical protein
MDTPCWIGSGRSWIVSWSDPILRITTCRSPSRRARGVAGGSEWQEFPQDAGQLDRWRAIMGKPWTPTEADGVDLPPSGTASSWKCGSKHPMDLWFVTQFSPRHHRFHVADLLEAAGKPGIGVALVLGGVKRKWILRSAGPPMPLLRPRAPPRPRWPAIGPPQLLRSRSRAGRCRRARRPPGRPGRPSVPPAGARIRPSCRRPRSGSRRCQSS